MCIRDRLRIGARHPALGPTRRAEEVRNRSSSGGKGVGLTGTQRIPTLRSSGPTRRLCLVNSA
eukprot:15248901-Alexandrium_andersonii.AAC.1